MQAASSLDPTFWSIHPTIERLWMYKRLTGTMTDLTWPDETTSEVDDDGKISRKQLSLFADSCEGHRGSDVFPFGLFGNETDFQVSPQMHEITRGTVAEARAHPFSSLRIPMLFSRRTIGDVNDHVVTNCRREE